MYILASLLFFDVPLLYYYTNLNSSIICYLFFGDIYLSSTISISSLASLFCECSSLEDFLEIFVILSAILLPIKSAVASAVFETVFIAFVIDFSAVWKIFYYTFTYILSLGSSVNISFL